MAMGRIDLKRLVGIICAEAIWSEARVKPIFSVVQPPRFLRLAHGESEKIGLRRKRNENSRAGRLANFKDWSGESVGIPSLIANTYLKSVRFWVVR